VESKRPRDFLARPLFLFSSRESRGENDRLESPERQSEFAHPSSEKSMSNVTDIPVAQAGKIGRGVH